MLHCWVPLSTVDNKLFCRVRKQTETERRKSVVRIFVGMFAGCIKRHQIWNVVPWDPGAW